MATQSTCSCANPACRFYGCLNQMRIGDPQSPARYFAPIERTTLPNMKGWQCPKCDRIHAPHVSGCEKCNV